MKKRLGIYILAILVLMSGISVQAAGCKLRVSLGEEGDYVQLSLYQVAYYEGEEYEYLPEYDGLDVDFAQLNTAARHKEAASAVDKWIVENDVAYIDQGITNQDGVVRFTVQDGIYLIRKTSDEGVMNPFLVIVAASGEEEYLDASPKYSELSDPGDPEEPDTPDDSESSEESDENVGTGDDSNIILWAGACCLALVSVIGVLKYRKRF